MPKQQYSRQQAQLQAVLEEQAKCLGTETRLVQRTSKLGAMELVSTLVLGWLYNPSASLNQLAQFSGWLGVQISAAGLHQRLNGAMVAVLEGLLKYSLSMLTSSYQLSGTVLSQFKGGYAVDSSVISLPAYLADIWVGVGGASSAAAVRLQVGVELLSGCITAIEPQDGRCVDQQSTLIRRLMQPGSLLLFDLGYFSQDRLAALVEVGAYFVCRYKFRTGLYCPDAPQQPLQLVSYLSQVSGSQAHRLDVLVGRRQRVPAHLIVQRLPPTIAQQRRRKAKRKAKRDGQTLSADYLRLLDWSIYVTNTTPEQLTPAQVITTYRMRWQVELIFKLWKSQAQLDEIGQWRTERVLCHLYARLLGLVIFHWLSAPIRSIHRLDLSWVKAFQVLQPHLLDWMRSLAQGWHGFTDLLARLTLDWCRFAVKNKRRKSPSTWQQLACLPLA